MAKGSAVWRAAASRNAALAAIVTLVVPTAVTGIPRAAAQEWKPDKPVEIVATNAPGGGSDRIGRIMIKILQDHRYVPTPINLVNKPGGAAALPTTTSTSSRERPLPGLGSRSLITNHISGHGPSYTELTPVVRLFDEYIAVTVKPVSPITTGKDLISFMKRDSTALSFGIATSLGAPNHSGVAAPFKAVGIDLKKMKNVIFASGGAASTALMADTSTWCRSRSHLRHPCCATDRCG